MAYLTRKFQDKDKLQEMLKLRREGWTLKSLAFFYSVDHSSIYHLCKKYHVKSPEHTLSFEIIPLLSITIQVIKKPITYKEFLEREANRKLENSFPNTQEPSPALK